MRLVDGWTRSTVDTSRSLPFALAVERRETTPLGPTRPLDRIRPKSLGGFPPGLVGLKYTRGRQGAPTEQTVPAGADSDANRNRYQLRRVLRPIQAPLQRACGHTPIGPVYIGAGWQRGCVTCKSAHACPVCSAKLRMARADEVQRAVTDYTADGGTVGMLTLTIRHHAGMPLRLLRRVVCDAWRLLWTGREGRSLRAAFPHFVRALDVTWGNNGWHPHIHALLFSDETLPASWLQAVRERWYSVVATLLPVAAPRTDSVGVHFSPSCSRAEYICKLNLELSDITSKVAAPGHATPWQIARLAHEEIASGVRHGFFCRLWIEWSRGMKGARHLTWSRGLRVKDEMPQDGDELERDAWAIILQPRDWSLARDAGLNAARVLSVSTEGPERLLAEYTKLGFWTKGPETHIQGGTRIRAWRVWKPTITQTLERIGYVKRE